MGRSNRAGSQRRKLRSPAARARARHVALLRAWVWQRATHFLVVFALLAPFGIMAAFGQVRVALGVAPSISTAPANQTLSYTEDQFLIIDPDIIADDVDPPSPEGRIITANFIANNPGSAQMLVRDVGPITVTQTSQFSVRHNGDLIGTYPAAGIGAGINGLPLHITLTNAETTVTEAILQELMRAIAYTDTSQNPNSVPPNRVIEFQIVDPLEGNSGTIQYTITSLTQTNDAPQWTVPAGPLAVADDTNLPIDPDPTVADVDAGANAVVITISVPAGQGTLTMTGCGVSGSGTNALSFSNAVTNANLCLQTLVYRSPVSFSGTVTITYQVSDQGFSVGIVSSGVPLTDTDTTTVEVTPVNDPPVLSDPGAKSVFQNQPLTIGAISVSDSDAGAGQMAATLTVSQGTLNVDESQATTTGDETAIVALTGTLAQLDAALDTIVYTSTGGFTGVDTLVIVVDDQGNTGSGGAQTATRNVSITVGVFNDPPVITVPGTGGGGFDGSTSVTEDVLTAVPGISVADPDAGSAPISLTLTVSSGTITLGSTTGLTPAGPCAGVATCTFQGSQADWNTALATLSYQTALNAVADVTLTVQADDQGNTGDDGAKTDLKTVRLTVSAVNDAPTATVPAAQTTDEETALVFSSGNSNQISVADVDVGTGQLRVSLGVAHGILTLATTANLTFQSGANGTAALSFDGQIADVLAALNGLTYLPDLNYRALDGPEALTIQVNDLGNTGAGTPLTDSDSVAITVQAVNDAPTVTAPGGTLTPAEDTPFTITGVSIADVDANPDDVRVTLTATNGTLSVKMSAIPALSFGAGDGTGDSTMTFDGTLAEVNDALSALSFLGTTNYNGPASVLIAVDDLAHNGSGGAKTANATVTLAVGAQNDGPTVSVPSPTETTTEDTPLIINGVGIQVADPDANSSDIEVTLTASHGSITLDAADTGALTSVTGNGTHTVVFRGTVSEVNAALNPLTYLGDPNNVQADTLNIAANDLGNTGTGGVLTGANAIAISFTAVNDPPALTAPAAAVVNEDTPTAISAISVADPDVGAQDIQITLSVTNGNLTLGTRTGLTFGTGDGLSDTTMTFRGSLANVNTALGTVVYRGNQDYNGPDTITITPNDLGHTGSAGPAPVAANIAITVSAENDGPVITVPAPQSVAEDTNLVITGVDIRVDDVDVGGNQLEVYLSVGNGVLTLNTTAGLTFNPGGGDGTTDPTLSFRGTLTNVNNALQQLVYRGNVNFNGADPLTIVAGDMGNTGAGGAKSDNKVLTITVTGSNDPPVVTVPGAQAVTEDTNKTITGISIADQDIGSNPLRVTLRVVSGTVTLASTAGLTFSTGDGTADPTLVFTGTTGNVNAALASVVYRGNQDAFGTDTLTVIAEDQGATGTGGPGSDTETVTLNVASVNDAPVLTLPAPVVTASTPAAVIIDGQATVADADSASFATGTLTVNISSGASSSDRLSVRNQGAGSGQIGVSGTTISYGGTSIATFTGEVSDTTPLVITFNASATRVAVEALVRNVTFRITDAEPTVSNRTVRFVLTDGDGDSSGPVTKQVRVAPLADLTLTATDTGLKTYNRNDIVSHTVTVSNRGPLTATVVVLTNRLPAELVFQNVETSRGSCSGGQVTTCNLGSVAVGQTVRIMLRVQIRSDGQFTSTFDVTATSDDPNPSDNRVGISIHAPGDAPGPNHPGDDKPIEREEKEKFTEEQRQQKERTNRLGLDDYRTEGNVVDVNLLADQPYATIAMRDGLQRIMLPCKDGCPTAQTGDYLEADGVKEHEALFYAENVTLTRNGKKVK